MDLTHHIFGRSKLKEIKIGDLVRWHSLTKDEPIGYKENIGIIANVYVDRRGGRDVAMAKIIPLGSDSIIGQEMEMFIACLRVISPSLVE